MTSDTMTHFKSEQKQFGSTLVLEINFSQLRVAFSGTHMPELPVLPPFPTVLLQSLWEGC